MTTATTVTLDREIVEQLIVEIDAVSVLETLRNGRVETALSRHVLQLATSFELAALGSPSDEELERRMDRSRERARELLVEHFDFEIVWPDA